jgi:hypothetical protein
LGALESRAMTTSLLWVSRESAHADSDDFFFNTKCISVLESVVRIGYFSY